MADIKLKDFSGESDKYTNVPKVWLESADSTEENIVLLPFSYGEAVTKTVEPDFSAGDMAVDIPSGQLVSELTVKKPPSLVPSNIAKDVNIAGIIGTLTGGGGGEIGSTSFASGTYTVPSARRILSYNPTTWDGALINSRGFWQKTMDPGEYELVAGRLYNINYLGYRNATAEEHNSFSSYGKCVTLGNKMLATNNRADWSSDNCLLIYQQNLNRLTIIAVKAGSAYLEDGHTWQTDVIYVLDLDDANSGMQITHGKSTKPDFVCIVSLRAFQTGMEGLSGTHEAIWGAKSALAPLIRNNRVAGFSGTAFGVTSGTDPLELSYSNQYLYCPDNVSFALAAGSGKLLPGATYWWFAIWGLTNQSE